MALAALMRQDAKTAHFAKIATRSVILSIQPDTVSRPFIRSSRQPGAGLPGRRHTLAAEAGRIAQARSGPGKSYVGRQAWRRRVALAVTQTWDAAMKRRVDRAPERQNA